jgi:hypothetical protein
LLLHVIDASSPERERRIDDVEAVLDEIGAKTGAQLLVCNKIDLNADQRPRIDRGAEGRPWRIWLSAQTGEGIDLLLQALSERLRGESSQEWLLLGPNDGALRAWLFEHARVLDDTGTEAGGWRMRVEVSNHQLRRHLQDDLRWRRCREDYQAQEADLGDQAASERPAAAPRGSSEPGPTPTPTRTSGPAQARRAVATQAGRSPRRELEAAEEPHDTVVLHRRS